MLNAPKALPTQEMSVSASTEPDRARLLGTAILGILASTALFFAIGAAGLVPDTDPSQQLQAYQASPQVYAEYGWGFTVFGLLGIPFVVALGLGLRRQNAFVASIGTTLWGLGTLVLALSVNLYWSMLASIDAAAGSAPTPASATYQAAVVNDFLVYPTTFGWIAFGAGFFLIAWLARRSKFVPSWLGIIGLIGGIGSAPIGPLPEFLGNFGYGVFGFGCAVVLLRRAQVRLRPVGAIMVAIGIADVVAGGLPISTSIKALIAANPVAFLFLIAGAVLVWLGWKQTRPASSVSRSD